MCKICDNNPKAHSFERIAKENGKCVFYSCPGDAEDYWDEDGIITHMREEIDKINMGEWIYIFDGKGFELKHALEISLAKSIITLLQEHPENLKEIRLINTTSYVNIMMNLISPFMPEKIYKKIIWKS